MAEITARRRRRTGRGRRAAPSRERCSPRTWIRRGLSARALAAAIGVPHNRIAAILKGRRAVTDDTALRLAGYFGTSAEYWLKLCSSAMSCVWRRPTSRRRRRRPSRVGRCSAGRLPSRRLHPAARAVNASRPIRPFVPSSVSGEAAAMTAFADNRLPRHRWQPAPRSTVPTGWTRPWRSGTFAARAFQPSEVRRRIEARAAEMVEGVRQTCPDLRRPGRLPQRIRPVDEGGRGADVPRRGAAADSRRRDHGHAVSRTRSARRLGTLMSARATASLSTPSTWALMLTGKKKKKKVVRPEDAARAVAEQPARCSTGSSAGWASRLIREAMRHAMRILAASSSWAGPSRRRSTAPRGRSGRATATAMTCWGRGGADPCRRGALLQGLPGRPSGGSARRRGGKGPVDGPGISGQSSPPCIRAMSPAGGRSACRRLVARLKELSLLARQYDIGLTVDAEEADRLGPVARRDRARFTATPSLDGWDGFGLALQAYQNGGIRVIDW